MSHVDPPVPHVASGAEAPARKQRHFGLHILGGVFVVAAGLGVFALSSIRHKAQADESTARKQDVAVGPKLKVVAVKAIPPERTATLLGEVRAYRQVTLYSKVSGYLKEITVDKGDRVRAGQVLGRLEAPEAEQEVLSRAADLQNKRTLAERYKSLAKDGLVSKQDLDTALSQQEVATADVARVRALRDYEVIRAPFAGVITTRYADLGALLQAATSSQSALPLVDLADLERLRIYVHLAQLDALSVREGDPVVLTGDELGGQKVEAKITRFGRSLDPRTRTMATEIEVQNPGGAIYPGAFVRVSLRVHGRGGLVMPADALVNRAGKNLAVVVRDGARPLRSDRGRRHRRRHRSRPSGAQRGGHGCAARRQRGRRRRSGPRDRVSERALTPQP